jgi:hypothetical protein
MAEWLKGRPPEEVAWLNEKRSKGALGQSNGRACLLSDLPSEQLPPVLPGQPSCSSCFLVLATVPLIVRTSADDSS